MPRKKKQLPFYKKIQPATLLVAVLLMFALAIIGSQTMRSGDAAPRNKATTTGMYLTPGSGRASVGSTVSVTLYANSGDKAVNALQTRLLYPADKLEYLGMTEGGIFTVVAATDISTPGVIQLARGVAPETGSVSGKHPVVTLNFKVTSSARGTVMLSLDSQSTLLLDAISNSNISNGVAGASFRVK